MINRSCPGELNSRPTVLIAAAAVEFKSNEANIAGIELTCAIGEARPEKAS